MPSSKKRHKGKKKHKAGGGITNAGKEDDAKKEGGETNAEREAKKSPGSLAMELSRMILVDLRSQGQKNFSKASQVGLAKLLSEWPEEKQRRIHQQFGGAIAEDTAAQVKWAMSQMGYSEEQQDAFAKFHERHPDDRERLQKLAIQDASLYVDSVKAAHHLEMFVSGEVKNDGECMHGFELFPCREALNVVKLFFIEMIMGKDRGDVGLAILATWEKWPSVWVCFPAMTAVQSYFLWLGTDRTIKGKEYTPNMCAYVVRIIEYVTEKVKENQGGLRELDWEKIINAALAKAHDLVTANDRALVTFFRKRIPCKCLDEKHEQTKRQIKTSVCLNKNCTFHLFERTEKSKMMRCSRCRNSFYCSRECQVADYPMHKLYCQKVETK